MVVVVSGASEGHIGEMLGKDMLSHFVGVIVNVIKKCDNINGMVMGWPATSSAFGWDAAVARVGVGVMELFRRPRFPLDQRTWAQTLHLDRRARHQQVGQGFTRIQ